MRHNLKGRKLNRTTSHRRSLFANLAVSLIQKENIKTTLPKAKDLRPFLEKLVTLAKRRDLHARRQLVSILRDRSAAAKLMGPLADRHQDRPGGYLRIIKAGFRYGDNAPMAVIEFVDSQAIVPVGVTASAEAAPASA
jgi:large subunit ribosomal protein L17